MSVPRTLAATSLLASVLLVAGAFLLLTGSDALGLTEDDVEPWVKAVAGLGLLLGVGLIVAYWRRLRRRLHTKGRHRLWGFSLALHVTAAAVGVALGGAGWLVAVGGGLLAAADAWALREEQRATREHKVFIAPRARPA